jgi:hypothetical protein
MHRVPDLKLINETPGVAIELDEFILLLGHVVLLFRGHCNPTIATSRQRQPSTKLVGRTCRKVGFNH